MNYSDDRNLSALIKSIDSFGKMTIRFNQSIEIQNLKLINKTVLDIYVRSANQSFANNKEQLNLTWNPISF